MEVNYSLNGETDVCSGQESTAQVSCGNGDCCHDSIDFVAPA